MPKDDLRRLLQYLADYACNYRGGDATRIHAPTESYVTQATTFELPDLVGVESAEEVIADLIARAEPGLAATTGTRFFGWVIGGCHPVGLAADWLTGVWHQNAGNHLGFPAASAAEDASAHALLELLDLPRRASVGFVTGATLANFTCLAAARGEVLRQAGWDVEGDGLFGAPPITVLLGEQAHATVFAALKFLGLGDRRVQTIETDANGAILPKAAEAAINKVRGPAIFIGQAGHINSGAFDPFLQIADVARDKHVWMHIDGAFGLWARAAPEYKALTAGADKADSWAVDGHKWLQTPYDCGYAIVRDKAAHQRAMQITASYLPGADDGGRNPSDYAPELSRRARGFATWAIIRHLGHAGIAEIIDQSCRLAKRFAEKLEREPDIAVLNAVVINQVALRFGTDLPPEEADCLTQEAIGRIQVQGICFVGGARWRDAWIIRCSVSGYAVTETDIDISAEAVIAAWRAVRASPPATAGNCGQSGN